MRGSSGDVGVNGGGGLFPAVVGRRSGVLQLHAASSARGFICTRIQLHAASGACGLFCVNRPRLGLTAAETGWKKAAWAGGSEGDFDVAEVGWWL